MSPVTLCQDPWPARRVPRRERPHPLAEVRAAEGPRDQVVPGRQRRLAQPRHGLLARPHRERCVTEQLLDDPPGHLVQALVVDHLADGPGRRRLLAREQLRAQQQVQAAGRADLDATRRSQAAASARPLPTQAPRTTARLGTGTLLEPVDDPGDPASWRTGRP